jgi:hypothetical protein
MLLSPHFVVREVALMYPSRILDSGRTLLLHRLLVLGASISNKSADDEAVYCSISFCWLRTSQDPKTLIRYHASSAFLQKGIHTFPYLFAEGIYFVVRKATSALTVESSNDAAICHVPEDDAHWERQLAHGIVAHRVEVVDPTLARNVEEEPLLEHRPDGEVLSFLFRAQVRIQVM